MKLKVNGKEKELTTNTTLESLLAELGLESGARGIAVAVNDTVVPKSAWATTRLRDGDTVEIIRAVQGG